MLNLISSKHLTATFQILFFSSICLLDITPLFTANVYVADYDTVTMMGKVSVVDSGTNAVIAEVSTTGFGSFVQPFGVKVSNDGLLVAVTDRGNSSLYFIDAMTNAVTAQVMGLGNPILSAITPDKSKVVVTDLSGAVYIVDAMPPYTVTPVSSGLQPAFMNPLGVAISNDGSTAYVPDQGTKVVYVISIGAATATNLVLNSLTPFTAPTDIEISSDGTFAFLTDYNGANVYKIDMTALPVPTVSSIVSNTFTPFIITNADAITPDGLLTYVSDFASNNLYKISAPGISPSVLTAISNAGFSGLTGVAVIPDGSLLYLASFSNGKVFSVDTASNVVTEVTTTGFNAFINPAAVAATPVSTPPPSFLMPPRNLQGRNINNDFGVVYYLSNLLTWQRSLSVNVAGYHVYRNGTRIATLGSSTLQYTDSNVPKDSISYSVTAFDAIGNESTPVQVRIK